VTGVTVGGTRTRHDTEVVDDRPLCVRGTRIIFRQDPLQYDCNLLLIHQAGVGKMSERDLRKVESFLLDLLRTSTVPVTPEELLRRGKDKGPIYSEEAIRQAVWRLVESGQVVFEPDWSLKSA